MLLRPSHIVLYLLLLCSIVPTGRVRADEPKLNGFKVESTSVVYDKDPGYNSFLIPVVVKARDGKLLAFAEGRVDSAEDDAIIHVVLKTSSDNGKTWSPLSVVHSDGERSVGNPAAVLDDETGTIWLLFCKDNKEIWLSSTNDGGATWATPVKIDDLLRNPKKYDFVGIGPGHGIQLTSGKHVGRLLVTAYGRLSPGQNNMAGSRSFAIFSDDHGKTWATGEMTQARGENLPDGNECMAVELEDGSLYLTIRNNISINGRGYSRSTDGGETWEAVSVDHNLPEPVCQASVNSVKLSGGQTVETYISPSLQAKRRYDKEARKNLSLWVSQDDCENWNRLGVIHEGYSGYSDQVVLDGGELGCLYASGSQRHYGQINFVVLRLGESSEKATR